MSLIRTNQGDSITATTGADQVARLPQPGRFAKASLLLPSRAKRVAEGLAEGVLPINQVGYDAMVSAYPLTAAAQGPYSDPFFVPNVYDDPDGSAAAVVPFRYDGIRAMNFARRWQMTGDPAAAVAAVRQLQPWTAISAWNTAARSDTRLVWSYTWPMFLDAAQLVRDSPAYTPEIEAGLRDVTQRSIRPCSTAYTADNNHGDWGVMFEFACSSFLGDQNRFDAITDRWKYLIGLSIDANDAYWHEIYRQGSGQGNGSSGLLYSNFALQAKTYAAEVARANGRWLYDYVSPNGRSLRPTWDLIADWTAMPSTYPYYSGTGTPGYNTVAMGHYEILQALWPRNGGQAVLDRHRPMPDRYGTNYLTVTHATLPLHG